MSYSKSLSGDPRRARVRGYACGLVMCLFFTTAVQGQAAGSIRGVVRAADGGAAVSGALVSIPAAGVATRTDVAGRYVLPNVPAGRHDVVAQRLGLQRTTLAAEVAAGGVASLDFELGVEALLVPAMVVSATGESRRLIETAAAVGVISSADLRESVPTHPSAVMAQIPGVWVSVTGGEGHMTAIRQPQSTKPMYLFLEDGVPTRSTGFFNHNALYEVNLPQADRVEVLKGPATALYGSDAIGGVINVETRRPSRAPSAEAFAEAGAFGYGRILLSGSDSRGPNGVRADLNLTRAAGWRDATGYDRQTATVRWDTYLGTRTSVRTVLTGSRIDQQTAGSSALPRDEYLTHPTLNRTPISLRNVRAARLSTAIEYHGDRTLASVTPYARWNDMELLPNWSLTYDPTVYWTGHSSVGFLARLRRDLPALHADVVAGVDVDYSPGGRTEHRVGTTREGSVFTGYALGERIYDYEVTFRAVSPYAQATVHPAETLHLTLGMRYDDMAYDYRTRLASLQEGRWRRPADARPGYRHLSPKLGLSYEAAAAFNVYANYTHGFRAPSEGQLFRQGGARNTVGLEPVTADSYELGARGEIAGRLGYSLAAYRMRVGNDILGYTQPDGTPETQNAGETLHRGVEAGLELLLGRGVRGTVSYALAKHDYVSWRPRETVDYSGREMESAPNTILNARLAYSPPALVDTHLVVEWNRIGGYWLDPENTHRYEGHDLLNLQASVPVPGGLALLGRVQNVLDSRYAESAGYTVARGEELSPGMPRTVYLGARYRWER